MTIMFLVSSARVYQYLVTGKACFSSACKLQPSGRLAYEYDAMKLHELSVEIDGLGLLSHIDIIHATRFILLYRNNYYSQTAPTALLLLVLPTASAQCPATLLRSRPSA